MKMSFMYCRREHYVFIIALICHFICVTNGHILRMPCLKYANFSIAKPDSALNEDILEKYDDLSDDDCQNKCIMHTTCKSINTKNSTGESCQLSGKSIEDPFDNVKLSAIKGWTYKTTDHKARNIGLLCQELNPCPVGLTCVDTCTCPGYGCQVTQTEPTYNCQDAYKNGYSDTMVFSIYIPGINFVDVRCDMVTDGGGWIVFQRRVDASVDFYRGWDDYKNGFGDLNGNFWLGLEKLHKLTSQGKGAILRVDLKHVRNPSTLKYAVYNEFEIGSEAQGYKLKVGGYSGNAGDSLSYHNGGKFTTKDRDNDDGPTYNCAVAHFGAWWFRSCQRSTLNGRYPQNNQEAVGYMTWWDLHQNYGGVIFSEMKLRYSSS